MNTQATNHANDIRLTKWVEEMKSMIADGIPIEDILKAHVISVHELIEEDLKAHPDGQRPFYYIAQLFHNLHGNGGETTGVISIAPAHAYYCIKNLLEKLPHLRLRVALDCIGGLHD